MTISHEKEKLKKELQIEILDDTLEKKILQNLSEKATSSRVAIQGMSLFKMLKVVQDTKKRIDLLVEEYENVENLFFVKRYPQQLANKSYLIHKLMFKGMDNKLFTHFMRQLTVWRSVLDEQIGNLEETKKHNSLCGKCEKKVDESLVFFLDSQGVLDFITGMVEQLENNTKIELPINHEAETNAKKFRKLLIQTQSVGRESELMFTYFLRDTLREQGQLRRDYQEIETSTNLLYSRLYVTQGMLKLDQEKFGSAIRSILKALSNLSGDINTLQTIILMTIMNMITQNKSDVQIRNAFSKALEKNIL